MAEGFLKHLAGDRFEAYSAGVEPTGEIHPCAVEALREVGIDLPDQYPKGLRTYMGKVGFNYLIIVRPCRGAQPKDPPRRRDDLLVDLRGSAPRRGPPLRLHTGGVPGRAGPDGS
jgi:protein-tyrosine-phosphatase